jgi:hypothetical protein
MIVKKQADEVEESNMLWKNSICNDLAHSQNFAVIKNKKICCYFSVFEIESYINVSLICNQILLNGNLIKFICKYIFEQWPASHKIVLYLLRNDWYGCYLAKAAGFTQEVVFREHYRVNNKKVDCIVFATFNNGVLS